MFDETRQDQELEPNGKGTRGELTRNPKEAGNPYGERAWGVGAGRAGQGSMQDGSQWEWCIGGQVTCNPREAGNP